MIASKTEKGRGIKRSVTASKYPYTRECSRVICHRCTLPLDFEEPLALGVVEDVRAFFVTTVSVLAPGALSFMTILA